MFTLTISERYFKYWVLALYPYPPPPHLDWFVVVVVFCYGARNQKEQDMIDEAWQSKKKEDQRQT